ncbi:MAG: hypothetical protein OFPI_06820 [Osedax symbiont Rs2]|nr:MAG: hypothetical protein OFPI_06820 [Osedax symbiont Rs2]
MRNFTCISVAALLALPTLAMADDYLITQNIVISDKAEIKQQYGGSNIQAFNNAELDSSYGIIKQKSLLDRFMGVQNEGAGNLQAINRIKLDDNKYGTVILQEVEANSIKFSQQSGSDNQQAANYAEFESEQSYTTIIQNVSADEVSMKQDAGNDNLQSLNSIKLIR